MPLEYALQYRASGQFADPGPWKQPTSVSKPLTGPLGIDSLARQRVIRSQRVPFALNVLVAGETGLGKTTFINTLFDSKLTDQWKRETIAAKTVEIKPVTFGE
ncbi:hypothetical protein M427DRAFT_195262 [Gonapodya prolifera JEL478]|uniref:Septin-type G domain-containing protein n=1 Tax=Gonapodya prolifera (strain JEL478) TaxID=1344416 RepID=A0A139APB8_GONPJ|nr:hypothetical protein M427DRAFT_195262 [Gonapodya prolifera JEL478]|eukprot:KXS18586.1 hypothetical protein M427DRAFT_195262 [Gonapodya prolifera JEL478]